MNLKVGSEVIILGTSSERRSNDKREMLNNLKGAKCKISSVDIDDDLPIKVNLKGSELWLYNDEFKLNEDWDGLATKPSTKPFTKQDLKDNMIVVYRNGDLRFVCGDYILYSIGNNVITKGSSLDKYDDTLNRINRDCELDIVKVYANLNAMVNNVVLWERDICKDFEVNSLVWVKDYHYDDWRIDLFKKYENGRVFTSGSINDSESEWVSWYMVKEFKAEDLIQSK